MENKYNVIQDATEIDNEVHSLVDEIGNTTSKVLDISEDAKRVVSMTPKDGYQMKLGLISAAEDMSTKEKLKAIDEAENKYAQDLSNTAELCKGIMWTKVCLFVGCTAGLVFMVSTPEGKKMAKTFLDKVA
jgi:hypothetical protein